MTSAAVIQRCKELARFSEDPDRITRRFLSPPMRDVHRTLGEWMERLGMHVRVDAAGNLRGEYEGRDRSAARLLIGSHVDTVPDAGAYDGVLGVVLGIALIEALAKRRFRFGIEIVAFSEEEGVRFGVPFIGSRALAGTLDDGLLSAGDAEGITVAEAIRRFGLDPARVPEAAVDPRGVRGYLEFHIEQGPVLESLNLGLGVVTAIAGQSRLGVTFRGAANHAGTTPMHLRRDALAAAAQWISTVEKEARTVAGLVATVGQIDAKPGVGNVIAGEVRTSLDVRHASDVERHAVVTKMLAQAEQIGKERGITVEVEHRLDQAATGCDEGLVKTLESAVSSAGFAVHRMVSGAGHDAMVLAGHVPVAMLFLRSPKGVSHHPDEAVLEEDVDAALQVGLNFLAQLEAQGG
ncbi:MAG TPA: allantoate amidohydrolase [Terriglobales bacterium]|nr:allantoate amidohydrolase [Terriglobales bacterium]